ncbi:MAG: ubiquitin-like small archaeal modifier protein (SAMP) [uncultured archaeon A07HR60]|jgi:MoaD family protein, archaeal|nr:MAG: ubiquitin-like small archaeal modifier protein (SAMP) [uncultured archaeon A07HR60]
MQWKLFADLSEIAGGRTVEVDLEADSETEVIVGEALDALLVVHPDLEDRVMEDGDLSSHINVLKNGSDVREAAGLDTPVEADDELALFPPVSGGWT